jgi:hypothetical protein
MKLSLLVMAVLAVGRAGKSISFFPGVEILIPMERNSLDFLSS